MKGTNTMQIKRTIKDGFEKSGEVTTIGEEKMRQIIMQVFPLGDLNSRTDQKCYGSDEGIRRLMSGQTIESFYATYELINL
jgi:hypothetical protein